jgi:hypothetical protein
MADEGTPPEEQRRPAPDEPANEPPGFPPPSDEPGAEPLWLPPPPPPEYGPPPYGYPAGYPAGSGHWLHPLDVGRTFSAAWRLYRHNWRAMSAVIFLVTAPISIITGIYQSVVLGPMFAAMQDAFLRGDFTAQPVPPTNWLLTGLSLVQAILSLIASAAIVHMVDVSYRGGREGIGAGLRGVFTRIGTLIVAGILLVVAALAVAVIGALTFTVFTALGFLIDSQGLGVFLGLIAAVGAAAALIFVTLRWSMVAQTVVIEGSGATAALGRSWRLVAGSTWRVLGYFLLLGLVLLLVLVLLEIPVLIVALIVHGFSAPGAGVFFFLGVYSDPVAVAILALGNAFIIAAISPWAVAVLTLLYFDLRWRRGELRSGPPAP